MLALVCLLGSLGYGAGYEGYSDRKLYVGVYTPEHEYGWVISHKEIYLDTIFTKR